MNKRNYKLYKALFAKYSSLLEKFDALHEGHVKLPPERKAERAAIEKEMLEVTERMAEALQ